MIDYLKIHELPVKTVEILNNDRLTFPLSNVATTGEIMNRSQVAHWQELQFVVRGNKVSLKGSLHKHFEGGTNYRDFHLTDIKATIEKLAETFQFDPQQAAINFIEVGVNIPLNNDPTEIIKTLVIYRNNPFTPLHVKGKGFGRKCETQQFTIKVYNKSLQYGLIEPLMRFEVKIKRIEFLKRFGITGITLSDLKEPEIYPAFKKILLDILNGILLFDPKTNPDKLTTLQDRELFLQGRFPEFWQELPRQRKNEKIKKFGELAGTKEIKKQLEKFISEKWDNLTNPDKLTTLKMEPEKQKTGQINPTINGYLVTNCIVTNLPIKNPAPGKKYLTYSDIKWYCENGYGIYQKKLESKLTRKWKTRHFGEPLEKWFEEIAHKIRCNLSNTRRNPTNNTWKSYNNIEAKGPKLWETKELMSEEKRELIF